MRAPARPCWLRHAQHLPCAQQVAAAAWPSDQSPRHQQVPNSMRQSAAPNQRPKGEQRYLAHQQTCWRQANLRALRVRAATLDATEHLRWARCACRSTQSCGSGALRARTLPGEHKTAAGQDWPNTLARSAGHLENRLMLADTHRARCAGAAARACPAACHHGPRQPHKAREIGAGSRPKAQMTAQSHECCG